MIIFKVVAKFAVVFIVFGAAFLFGIKFIYSGSNKYEETKAYGGGSYDDSPFTAAGMSVFQHFVFTRSRAPNASAMTTVSISVHFRVSV